VVTRLREATRLSCRRWLTFFDLNFTLTLYRTFDFAKNSDNIIQFIDGRDFKKQNNSTHPDIHGHAATDNKKKKDAKQRAVGHSLKSGLTQLQITASCRQPAFFLYL
jgi:hypothetical protein